MKKHFSELVEIPKIFKLLESLHDITGVASTIIDTESNVIGTCGYNDICAKFHRVCPETEQRCKESAKKVFSHLDIPYIGYKCLNGLYDYFCPIMVEGEHIATLVAGQVLIEPPDEAFFRDQARKYGFDEAEYIKALHQVPIVEKEEMGKTLKVYADFASILAELGIQRVQKEKTLVALKESESKYRALFDHLSNGFMYLRFSGNGNFVVLEINNDLKKVLGRKKGEIEGRKLSETILGPELAPFANLFEAAVESGTSNTFEYHSAIMSKWIRVSVYSPQPKHLAVTFEDIDEQKRKAEQTQYEARHDVLTGLTNRRALEDNACSAIEQAQKENESVAVIYIDLDNFKAINDVWGHPAGDELLKQLAYRLQGCIRKSDTLSRFGGDEFVLLLPSLKTHDEAKVIAKRILDACRIPFAINDQEIILSGSLGISFFPEDGSDYSELLRSADAAMYEAKRQGRNRFVTGDKNC